MISLKPAYVSRYGSIAKLLLKYGQGDLVRQIGLGSAVTDDAAEPSTNGKPGPESLAEDLEHLGPTFIKLGQLLSTRPDFLPPKYLEALARLQDDVEPMPPGSVETTIEQELGVRISKAFAEFETEPLAAASVGQVHRARLRDGRRVVVKVQRPDLRDRVRDDLAAMQELGAVLDEHTQFGRRIRFVQIVESLQEVMTSELDYRQEAENSRTLKANLAEFEQFVIPAVIEGYTSPKVITLEYIEGAKITDVSPVVLLELDRRSLADQLFQIYLHQVLIDGVFHADPHPGNLILTTDRRIALMDFGMVARVTPELQRRLLKLLMALSDGRAEETARQAIAVGRPYRNGVFHEMEFREQVGRLVTANLGKPVAQLQAGRVVMELNAAAGETGLKLPNCVIMLGKTLMNLDKVVSALDPEFDPNAALKRHTAELFARQSGGQLSLNRVYETLLESAEFVERLPERLNKVSELVANNKLRVAVDAFNERKLMAGLQKIANRITTGLILAAMIIGASLMMRLNLRPMLFGYPLIALLFFLVAALTSCVLLWRIAFQDESPDD
ncbi:MAG TPA: AarF/UbiB family protein [Pirellulales bacterium]|jgi:predicted unusual protein kinase regulating ubiquinone biosynthesis (AarF/ABC1/UbiB family)|nr:AarF/UbiB family protein [Pirellulales bacterium]